MSKIVKKMKIMQSGGTLSDYVPIGAEAENINVDGESVETKLGKKPYYYDTVADMKADTKLKAGDMAVTLGYYSVNDGGGAEYNIIDDNGNNNDYCEELNNSLLAKLVIMNNTVIPEQFGAYGDNIHDDSSVLNQCILYCDSKQMTLLANKIYKITEPLLIDKSYLILNINELNYTGNDSAIKLKRSFCEINIYKISSTGKGILIEPRTTNTGDGNKINIDTIDSNDNCIEMNAYG